MGNSGGEGGEVGALGDGWEEGLGWGWPGRIVWRDENALQAYDLQSFPPEVSSRVRHGGFLLDAELFENTFFSIVSAEALDVVDGSMDSNTPAISLSLSMETTTRIF